MASKFWWLTLNIVSFFLLLMISQAEGATYDFYFNNSEQGPGSSATPSITIGAPESALSNTDPIAAPAGEIVAAPEPKPEVQSTHRRFKVGAHLTSTRWGRQTVYGGSNSFQFGQSSEREESRWSRSAASYSATYYPGSHFGVSLLWGSVRGAETELNILPSNAPISFGFLLGYGRAITERDTSFFWGIQAGLDFSDFVGLQLVWRDFGGFDATKASSLGAYVKF